MYKQSVSCFSCLDFDIAFNKPVTASSAWEDDLVLYAAKYATNGQANCTDPNGPIVHTKREDNAWIEVDLQKTYFIKTVVVEPRTGEFYILYLCKTGRKLLIEYKKKTRKRFLGKTNNCVYKYHRIHTRLLYL